MPNDVGWLLSAARGEWSLAADALRAEGSPWSEHPQQFVHDLYPVVESPELAAAYLASSGATVPGCLVARDYCGWLRHVIVEDWESAVIEARESLVWPECDAPWLVWLVQCLGEDHRSPQSEFALRLYGEISAGGLSQLWSVVQEVKDQRLEQLSRVSDTGAQEHSFGDDADHHGREELYFETGYPDPKSVPRQNVRHQEAAEEASDHLGRGEAYSEMGDPGPESVARQKVKHQEAAKDGARLDESRVLEDWLQKIADVDAANREVLKDAPPGATLYFAFNARTKIALIENLKTCGNMYYKSWQTDFAGKNNGLLVQGSLKVVKRGTRTSRGSVVVGGALAESPDTKKILRRFTDKSIGRAIKYVSIEDFLQRGMGTPEWAEFKELAQQHHATEGVEFLELLANKGTNLRFLCRDYVMAGAKQEVNVTDAASLPVREKFANKLKLHTSDFDPIKKEVRLMLSQNFDAQLRRILGFDR
jgi:hypothetical protein